tara:strand:- start:1383 stop:1961 length:579 start_codon:yes stop_codon:yes gene_type:complete
MKLKKLVSNKGNILSGPKIINPKIFHDKRGYFYESWNKSLLDENLKGKVDFVQDNQSCSDCGVLRGLHYQIHPKPQHKLVSCISGEIFDVAVDIRKSSPTFGEWGGVKLNNSNKLILWIPFGFAHGFLSLKNGTLVLYKVSGYWSENHEKAIRWNDKDININWPFNEINHIKPILSQKDARSPFLKETELFF